MGKPTFSRSRRRLGTLVAGVGGALVLALLVPFPERRPPRDVRGRPFAWRQDERWKVLEASFRSARAEGCGALAPRIDEELARGRRLLAEAGSRPLEPSSPVFEEIERTNFELGALVGACYMPPYWELVGLARQARAGLKGGG